VDTTATTQAARRRRRRRRTTPLASATTIRHGGTCSKKGRRKEMKAHKDTNTKKKKNHKLERLEEHAWTEKRTKEEGEVSGRRTGKEKSKAAGSTDQIDHRPNKWAGPHGRKRRERAL
jgi:hypothetical protein